MNTWETKHMRVGENLWALVTHYLQKQLFQIYKLEIKNNKYMQNTTAFARLAFLSNMTVILVIFFTATHHIFLSEMLEKKSLYIMYIKKLCDLSVL